VVTWTVTIINLDPLPQDSATETLTDAYDGNCTTADQVAALHPGSTVQQLTLSQTSSPADVPPGL